MSERPVLESERLRLRPFTVDDAEDLTRLANAWEIHAGTLLIPHPYERRHALDWITTHEEIFATGQGVPCAVELRDEGALLGACGLSLEAMFEHAELGYWIGRPHWGQGYATEACRTLLAYGFSERGLHRIHARHFESNPASGRVLEKLGFVHEGVLREHFKKGERWHDAVCYGLLKAEYEAMTQAERGELPDLQE